LTAPIARIEPLQVLRGLAAILIMAKHALYEVDLISPIDFNYGVYRNYTVGIDIFFVLSGFIMIYISRGQSGFSAARTFIFRRVLRIIPIYWFYTFLLAAVAFIIPQVLGKAEFIPIDFIKSLLFIPYFNSVGDMQPFLANGWSLNYEMYFYAIFAVCLILPVRYSLLAMAAYFTVSVSTDFFEVNNEIVSSFYGKEIVLEFLTGAVIGYLFIKNIRLPSWFFYVGLAFILGSVLALFFTQTLENYGIYYNKPLVGMLSVLLLVLPKKSEYFSMPRWSVLIGDSSYTLYLAHPFAIGAVTQMVLLMGWQSIIHPWIIFAIVFLTSIIGSYIAYRLIEKPLLSLTKKLVYKQNSK
jgi:exopolysaccharide production protein ExoZ